MSRQQFLKLLDALDDLSGIQIPIQIMENGIVPMTNWAKKEVEKLEGKRKNFHRRVLDGEGSNVINPVWLNYHVGIGKRFQNLLDLKIKLRAVRHNNEGSFAGGSIHQEIYLVDMMIADDDFRILCFNKKL